MSYGGEREAARLRATLPPLSEKDFLRQVVELAELRNWQWLHLRPGMTRDSWRTPISGPLGKGWPDLVLIRGHRMIFAELKAQGATTSPDQDRVLAALAETVDNWHTDDGFDPPVIVVTWWPEGWSQIEASLK